MEIVSYGRQAAPLVHRVAPRARTGSIGPRMAPRSRSGAPAPDEARVGWVDTAKGICIILVVMMHATLGVEAEMGREGFMHTVLAFAKPFRMPDFFLVSGLFLSRVIDRDWRSYADKRVVHFVYFYVLWLVIQSLFKVAQVSGGSPAGFLHHLALSLVEPYSTLWFIYILAIFSVVTKLLRGVAPGALFAAAAALQVLPAQTGSFLVDEFCERWVFFLAGYLFAAHVFRVAEWARAHAGAALVALGSWALVNGALALTPFDGPRSMIADLPVISLGLGLAGAMAIVAAASLISGLRLAQPLRYAGAQSIVIYLTFFLPMASARLVLIRTGIVEDAGIASAIVTAIAVIVPLGIERLVRGTRLSFLYRRPDWARLGPAQPRLRLQPAE